MVDDGELLFPRQGQALSQRSQGVSLSRAEPLSYFEVRPNRSSAPRAKSGRRFLKLALFPPKRAVLVAGGPSARSTPAPTSRPWSRTGHQQKTLCSLLLRWSREDLPNPAGAGALRHWPSEGGRP